MPMLLIPNGVSSIDGDTDNNTEENLQLLCRNCHGLTDDFKGAVKGKDGSRQKTRRKRYKDGKTW